MRSAVRCVWVRLRGPSARCASLGMTTLFWFSNPTMTKAVGIIPARWGSTRFPGKALHRIAGKPLLRHVWERCGRAKKLDRLIIATDDFRIAEAAFDWGAELAMTSPNHASGTDRIAEVASKLKPFAHIINIQG